MLKLILVRHGTTFANESGQYIGQSESPLSPKGQQEAIRLCKQLERIAIDKMYVSPSLRVLETVSYLNKKQVEIEVVAALREIDFGCYEGKDFNWLQKNTPQEVEAMLAQGEAYTYPKGESLEMLYQRVRDWLRDWLKCSEEGTFLIVAHGGTIRCILSELLCHTNALHWHFKIEPATLTQVSIEEGFAVLEGLNEK